MEPRRQQEYGLENAHWTRLKRRQNKEGILDCIRVLHDIKKSLLNPVLGVASLKNSEPALIKKPEYQ